MILTTTGTIEGKTIAKYLGLVTGQMYVDAILFRERFSGTGDSEMRRAIEHAKNEMSSQAQSLGATAVVGINIDFETIIPTPNQTLLMISVTGTAVII